MSNKFQSMFEEIGYALNLQEVAEWLNSDVNDSGVQICGDDDTHDEHDDEAEEGQKTECPVLNSEATRCFEQCLTWLEHQPEATPIQHNALERTTIPRLK